MLEESDHSPADAKFDSLEAYLISQEEGADNALERLEGRNDPVSVRRRLSILLEANRIDEAAELVKAKEPHKIWCDKAVSALVRNGDMAKAKQIIEWTKSLPDLKFRDRCCLLYAEARYVRAWRNRSHSEAILPTSLTNEEKIELSDALEILHPLVKRATANERIENELESVALQIAIKIHYLFANYLEVKNTARLLLTRKPIPLELVQFALNRLFDVPVDMTERLRTEHVDSFRAKISAAMIESEILGKHQDAFDFTISMVNAAKSDDEKREVCKVVYQLAQKLGTEGIREAERVATSLLGKDDRFIILMRADKLLRQEKPDEAICILQEIRDDNDPTWHQLYAQCLLQKGNSESAVDSLVQASKILPLPDILKSTAEVAFRYDRSEIACQTLEQALALEPDNISTLHNLAMVYTQIGDFRKAAEQFGRLYELEPEEPTNAVNYANSLARSGNVEESIRVYDSTCGGDKPRLEALIARSQLLKSINKHKEAFESLCKFKDEYWEEPNFVNALLPLSYAAQQDSVGHEAFLQLLKLQREGKAKRDVLFTVSLEQLLERAKKGGERAELIHKNTVEGKCPWLMADELLGRTSYMGWAARTQPLAWCGDDPVTRANFSVYATNGFHARKGKDGSVQLKQLECPPPGTEVVVDSSALITIHRLRLLEKAASYFGRLLVPSAYPAHLLKESDRLVFPQLSLVTATKNVKAALDRGIISTLANPGAPNQRTMPYVNEHTRPEKEEEHYYRIKDLADTLYGSGRISDTQSRDLAEVAHESAGAGKDHPGINLSQSILVDLLTLQTLDGVGVLELVLDSFDVHITAENRDTVNSEIAAVTSQEQLQQWHRELRETISGGESFVKTPTSHTDQASGDSIRQDNSISAAILAGEKKKPLFADDRVCQVLALNNSPEDDHVASFGTDKFLLALNQADMITAEQMADCILQLMKWRYRFIVPSKGILKTFAGRFKEHPPGNDLRVVALYVHDCMRDLGLFAGFERTDQPATIASKLFATWVMIIAEFLMDVWNDDGFSEDAAEQITEWALRELLPSSPKNLGANGYRLSVVCPRMFFSQAMFRAALMDRTDRANKGLQAIKEALDMDDKEYLKAIAEVVDAY